MPYKDEYDPFGIEEPGISDEERKEREWRLRTWKNLAYGSRPPGGWK